MSTVDNQISTQKKPFVSEAKEQGFVQFVNTISITFYSIPVSFVVIFALLHKDIPLTGLFVWMGVFFVYWAYAVLTFDRFRDEGPSSAKHLVHINIILIVEGLLWGALLYVGAGFSVLSDHWVAVIFVGMMSLIMPTCISYPRSFQLILISALVAGCASLYLISDRVDNVTEVAFSVSMYLIALAFLIKPISNRVIEGIRLELANQALTTQLQESLKALSHQANTDALTGQLNRHALNQALGDMVIKGGRRRIIFSVLMIDIDFFKSINDTYGHDVGDIALQHVAARISTYLRDGDLCARFGGEEFVILLPSTKASEAMVVAERIRTGVESSPLDLLPKQPITLSIGVATYRPGMTAEMLLKAADNEVYAAKQGGRNQVRLSNVC